MASKTILTSNQRLFLEEICRNKTLTKFFYLGGGTALAEFYLQHRLSEDLDFFTENEFDPLGISAFLKNIQKKMKIIKIDYQQSFNRNLFFVTIGTDTIKTEFTYYPFPRIDQSMVIDGLAIDSILYIAVNKVFTIYQRPRSRDCIDLYLIVQKTGWDMASLITKARAKFDYPIDLLQLGTQFVRATTIEDFPKMLVKLSPSEWQNFFMVEAKKFSRDILKP